MWLIAEQVKLLEISASLNSCDYAISGSEAFLRFYGFALTEADRVYIVAGHNSECSEFNAANPPGILTVNTPNHMNPSAESGELHLRNLQQTIRHTPVVAVSSDCHIQFI
eukprot:gene5951-5839_t